MSKVNPTPSRDGVPRADLRITARLSRDDKVDVLATWAYWQDSDDAPDDLSTQDVLPLIRSEVEGAVTSGHVANDAGLVHYAWAERQVAKVWPS